MTYREEFGKPPPAGCLRADPVHLRADTRGLILFDASTFALQADEAQALVQTLDTHLAGDGWRLVCKQPQRWYLLGQRTQHLVTSPLPTARATPVSASPCSGEDAATWMRRSNEIQMLMHQHPVNRRRAENGQPAVNSVWLWGGSERPPLHQPPQIQLAADNLFARGIARESGIPLQDLPKHAFDLLDTTGNDSHLLVVLEACRDAAAYEELAGWEHALAELERDWFAPLVRALKQRRVDVLQLYPLNGRCYRLTRRHLLAIWKGSGDYRRQAGFRQASANRV